MQQQLYQKVIIVVGATQRRLHALHMLLSYCTLLGMKTYGYSSSAHASMIKKLERRHVEVLFQPLLGAVPIHEDGISIAEMNYEQFLAMPSEHLKNACLLLADLRVDDELFGKDIHDKLVHDLGHGTWKEIIYNADTVEQRMEGMHHFYIDVQSIADERVRGFGTSELASYHMHVEKNDCVVTTKEQKIVCPVENIEYFSYLKKEGLFGMIAVASAYDALEPTLVSRVETFPFLERESGSHEVNVWTFEAVHPDEFDALLHIPGYTNIAMGLANYLRFEDVIEKNIEHFETILVVAEDDAQAELLGDYFLAKEHDSYHSIIFVPNSAEMRTALQRVFRGQEKRILYVFDILGTFIHIHE